MGRASVKKIILRAKFLTGGNVKKCNESPGFGPGPTQVPDGPMDGRHHSSQLTILRPFTWCIRNTLPPRPIQNHVANALLAPFLAFQFCPRPRAVPRPTPRTVLIDRQPDLGVKL